MNYCFLQILRCFCLIETPKWKQIIFKFSYPFHRWLANEKQLHEQIEKKGNQEKIEQSKPNIFTSKINEWFKKLLWKLVYIFLAYLQNLVTILL